VVAVVLEALVLAVVLVDLERTLQEKLLAEEHRQKLHCRHSQRLTTQLQLVLVVLVAQELTEAAVRVRHLAQLLLQVAVAVSQTALP
jgi:hypothetical protein